MGVQVALIEPSRLATVREVARACASVDVPLHLIGPFGFPGHEVARGELEGADVWAHEHWFAFRDAIVRERCYYVSPDAEQAFEDIAVADNTVFVFGSENGGMPARILEKHPERCVRPPEESSEALPETVRSVLLEVRQPTANVSTASAGRTPAKGRGGPPRRGGRGRGRRR